MRKYIWMIELWRRSWLWLNWLIAWSLEERVSTVVAFNYYNSIRLEGVNNTSMIYILGIGNWTWFSYNPINPLFIPEDRFRVRESINTLRFREDWVYDSSTKKWISPISPLTSLLRESPGNLPERFMRTLLTHKNNTKWSWIRRREASTNTNIFFINMF